MIGGTKGGGRGVVGQSKTSDECILAAMSAPYNVNTHTLHWLTETAGNIDIISKKRNAPCWKNKRQAPRFPARADASPANGVGLACSIRSLRKMVESVGEKALPYIILRFATCDSPTRSRPFLPSKTRQSFSSLTASSEHLVGSHAQYGLRPVSPSTRFCIFQIFWHLRSLGSVTVKQSRCDVAVEHTDGYNCSWCVSKNQDGHRRITP